MGLWEDEKEEYNNIEPGLYTAVLDESKLDTSKEPYVVTTVWRIVGDANFNDRKLWIRLQFSESAVKFVKWQTGVLGIGSELKECSTWNESAEKCHAMLYPKMDILTVELQVTNREYQGKVYDNAIIENVVADFKSSTVHSGVENLAPGPAPSFDANEEILF